MLTVIPGTSDNPTRRKSQWDVRIFDWLTGLDYTDKEIWNTSSRVVTIDQHRCGKVAQDTFGDASGIATTRDCFSSSSNFANKQQNYDLGNENHSKKRKVVIYLLLLCNYIGHTTYIIYVPMEEIYLQKDSNKMCSFTPNSKIVKVLLDIGSSTYLNSTYSKDYYSGAQTFQPVGFISGARAICELDLVHGPNPAWCWPTSGPMQQCGNGLARAWSSHIVQGSDIAKGDQLVPNHT